LRPKLSPAELRRNYEHEQEVEFRSKAVSESTFQYLDVFEKERQERHQA